MKKIITIFIIILVVILAIGYQYLNNISKSNIAKTNNLKFEIYINKEINGTELATIINKAINSNEQNEIKKDKEGQYIDNEKDSINIDIKFIDNDVTYNIEKISINGVEKFLLYYKDIEFKCVDVQYHNSTKNIKYMKFEQITQ